MLALAETTGYFLTSNPANPRNCFVLWDGDVIAFAREGANPYQLVKVTYDDTTPDILLESIVSLPPAVSPASIITMISTDVGGNPTEIIVIGTHERGVISYDGSVVAELAAAGTFTDRVIVSTYNGTLYAASTQGISRLPSGPGAVWADAVLPAAAFPAGVADFHPCFAVEYFGASYVGGYELIAAEPYACLLKVVENGMGATTVTIAFVDADAGSSLTAACVYNGALFFGYNYGAGYPGGCISSYNGSTFIHDLFEFGGTDTPPIVLRMLDLGSSMYVTFYGDLSVGVTEHSYLYRMEGDNTSLSVTELLDSAILGDIAVYLGLDIQVI